MSGRIVFLVLLCLVILGVILIFVLGAMDTSTF
jgi:hypothetical protein